MATLALNSIPDGTLTRLRQLATETGLDVEAEAVRCLERGLSEREQVEAQLKEIRAIREGTSGAWITDDVIRAARDEGRA